MIAYCYNLEFVTDDTKYFEGVNVNHNYILCHAPHFKLDYFPQTLQLHLSVVQVTVISTEQKLNKPNIYFIYIYTKPALQSPVPNDPLTPFYVKLHPVLLYRDSAPI